MKLEGKNHQDVDLCWDPPNEIEGRQYGYEIEWSIDNASQDLLDNHFNRCHTFTGLKSKQIIKAAVRAYFQYDSNSTLYYTGAFSDAVFTTVPDKKSGEHHFALTFGHPRK